jgi:curved DNA-binding protein CbpA
MFFRKIIYRPFGTTKQIIDPYKVLNVKNTASPKEIKISYIQLVKKWHPDKTDDGGEKFK